jgi:hypothetical protein
MFFNFDFSHVSESSKQEFLQEMQKIIGFSSRLPFLTMIGNDLIMSNKDLQDPKTGENPDPDLIVFNYHDAVFSSVKKIHSPAGFAHSFRYFRETKINPCLHDGRLLFAVIGRVKNFGLEYLATLENPKYPLNTIDFYLTSVKKNKHLFEPKN